MSSDQSCHQAELSTKAVSVAATYSALEARSDAIVSHHVLGRDEENKVDVVSDKKPASRLVMAQFAVTRVDVGAFRNVKTSARDTADYCRCLFEQDESEQFLRPQPHQGHVEKCLVDNRCCGQITTWLVLACGGPALEISHKWIRVIAYSPATRLLHIELCPSMFEINPWKHSFSDRASCADPTEGELLKSCFVDMYLSRLVDCNLMADIVHRISSHRPLPEQSRRYSSPILTSNPTSPITLSPVSTSNESLWVSMAGRTPERSSAGDRAIHSPNRGTGQRRTKRLSNGYKTSYSGNVDLVQEGSVKSEKPNKTTRRFSHGNPGSFYPHLMTYPSVKQPQTECIDLSHISTNSTNQKSMHYFNPNGASKLDAHYNLLRGIETGRSTVLQEQQDLNGQSPGYTQSGPQVGLQNQTNTSTTHVLDDSPVELFVYSASHQDAGKYMEQSSTQPYLYSRSLEGASISSEISLQATTNAMSPLLISPEKQPTSDIDIQCNRGDSDKEQNDKEDAELTRLCRRRCISTSEAEPLSPILPPSSSVALRHQANRRLSCSGRLETYMETEQGRSTNRDMGKGIYRSKRNSLTISTSFSVTDALCDTSMSSISDSGSDRRASISSNISDISSSLTHSTASLSSGSSSTSIHDIPRKWGPPVHYTLMCWIGGRWPCKLRPLIKKSTLLDIHTTLRRNLKLPVNYYIDIEFQWQGNTYMILDATHWQWAREQVNHGDMAIRCNIWQKRYMR